MPPVSSVLTDKTLSTQMNIRIERAVKAQGDAVLERFGMNPSQAVRGLWHYCADNNDVPDFLKEQLRSASDDQRARIRTLAQDGRGLAVRLAIAEGLLPESTEELRPAVATGTDYEEELYGGKLEDYHAFCR